MSLQVVHLEDIKPQPWRNGGGVTRELLAWPDAAHWCLRLSVADIEQDGPFSAFPGIERWFAVLTGEGVRLGVPAHVVTARDLPFQFDGAAAPDCKLIGGPTRDLNLMVRRDAALAWMQRVDSASSWPSPTPEAQINGASPCLRGVFTVGGCTLRCGGQSALDVPAMSLAWSESAKFDEPWLITGIDGRGATFAFECTQHASGRKRDV